MSPSWMLSCSPQNRSLTVLVSNMLEFINIFSASSLCAQKWVPSVGLA